jgi:hypothetical protein
MRKSIALLHWNGLKRARVGVKKEDDSDAFDYWDDATVPISLTFRRQIALSVIDRVKLSNK